jgi:predicted CoA-binding protein
MPSVQYRENPAKLQRFLAKRRAYKQLERVPRKADIRKLVRFQAHVRGFLDRLYTEVVVSCTMQEILETQDPDLEEQYDILDGLYTRVYSNY